MPLLARFIAIASLALGFTLAHGAPGTQAPTREAVLAARQALQNDPYMARTVRESTLRFKADDVTDSPQSNKPWLTWLRNFFSWFSDVSRMLVWLVAIALVAVFLVGLRRWIRLRAFANKAKSTDLPSHVHNLDIRPESLPQDIGAAAAALWQQGQHLACLSLLYRGALSRLVHVHGVAIRAASTEGDCLTLARASLEPTRAAFVAQLVRVWQLAVYAEREPDKTQALALCADFSQQLDQVAPGRSAHDA